MKIELYTPDAQTFTHLDFWEPKTTFFCQLFVNNVIKNPKYIKKTKM